MSSLSGKVQTVLGLVEPSKLGRTLTHEHLTMTFDCFYYPPSPCHEAISKEPIMMKNLFWIQNNPYSHKENLQLNQETEAIKEELLYFKAKGGGALVENTTTGISRDVQTLKWLAEQTGVHIIAGAGFYVDATHSAETRAMSVEQVKSAKLFDSVCVSIQNSPNLGYAIGSEVIGMQQKFTNWQRHLPIKPLINDLSFYKEKV